MQIVLNDEEEAAVRRYAVRKRITYGEALQIIIDSMTKGLMELAREDSYNEIIEFQRRKAKAVTTKIETLDSDAPASDTD